MITLQKLLPMNIETTSEILKKLVKQTNASGAIITSTDGLIIFSEFNINLNEDRIAASMQDILAKALKFTKKILISDLNQLTFQTNNGNLLIQAISEKYFISLFTELDTEINISTEKINSTIKLLNKVLIP